MGVRKEILTGIGLLLLVVAVYYPGLDAGLVADDFHLVGRLSFSDAWRSLGDTVGYGRNEYRPMVAFSFALSNALWDGNPHGYHLESILLHALNAVLIFTWLWLLTKSTAIAGAAAALFAVHPIHHERVVWIAARDSLLSTLFMLACLILYTLARRRSILESGTARGATRVFVALSLGFFSLSLLSYEGAIVLPGILIGLELLHFGRPIPGVWRRLRTGMIRVMPFVVVLVVYLAWWLILFRGALGQYDLSYRAGNLLGNCYRLLYQLFHDHQYLSGALYFFILLFALLLPRERRPLVWFSLLFTSLCFLPFVIITGFASRFAYASAIGYAFLIALLLSAGASRPGSALISRARPILPALALMIFVPLLAHYTVDLRARIAEWRMAGAIADAIPRQVKTRYPDLPDGSTLVLSGIPRAHGHAHVYPLGLQPSIERFYPGRKLRILYGPGDVSEILGGAERNRPNTILYTYAADQGDLPALDTMQK